MPSAEVRTAALALLLSCAHAAPTATADRSRPALEGFPGETQPHFLARVLVDACTSAPTDEVLIEHAVLILAGCHFRYQQCVRLVCRRIGEDDDPPTHMNFR